MTRMLRFTPVPFAIAAVALWGASFNDGRPSWETNQRIGAIALVIVAGALFLLLMKKNIITSFTPKGVFGLAVGLVGFMVLTMSESYFGFLGIVGMVMVIGAGSIIQEGGTVDKTIDATTDAKTDAGAQPDTGTAKSKSEPEQRR